MIFRMLFLLLVAIVILMFSWKTLRSRLASVRVLRHGLAHTDGTELDIDLGAMKEMASGFSSQLVGCDVTVHVASPTFFR